MFQLKYTSWFNHIPVNEIEKTKQFGFPTQQMAKNHVPGSRYKTRHHLSRVIGVQNIIEILKTRRKDFSSLIVSVALWIWTHRNGYVCYVRELSLVSIPSCMANCGVWQEPKGSVRYGLDCTGAQLFLFCLSLLVISIVMVLPL